ncbi:MAG: FAS1-like dehydratase domain-containing protein [Acidimicrobiales bacterium]
MAVNEFPVEKGAILMFARAVGDTNPIYYDESYAQGTEVGSVIAPPTFVQSSAQFDPDYPLRPKPGQKWFGSGRTPSGLSDAPAAPASPSQSAAGNQPSDAGDASGSARSMGSSLHAEQEFTYHRPIRPGDVLSATVSAGKRWDKQGRSGRLEFAETITEYRDQDGHLVVTARGVGVRTAGPVTKGSN